MNTMSMQAQPAQDAFVDLVAFKWLMAGVGWWVDLSRLQRDRAYTEECLQRAQCSGSAMLCQRAAALLGLQAPGRAQIADPAHPRRPTSRQFTPA